MTFGRAMPELDRTTERRLAAIVVAAAIAFFLIALVLAPPASPTYDDAKYVGIGRNVLAGNGPETVFGVTFLKHSPLWPVLVVLPERLVGLDPLAWGHLLNAVSAAAIILMAAVLGWRIRPVYGAAGAIGVLALPYFFDIARTAGIDMPSIALTFLYVLLGFVAVRRNSLGIGLLAGLVFAAAFLIKETVQPYALVPFLAGVLWGVSWTMIARIGAATLATAALGTAWWFALFAASEHLVYRLELPAWTLVPATLVVAVLVVLGLAAPRIAATERATRLVSAASSGRVGAVARRIGRAGFTWLVAGLWVVALSILFSRTSKLLGSSIVDPNQIGYYLDHTILSVRLAAAYGLGSVVLAIALVRGRPSVADTSRRRAPRDRLRDPARAPRDRRRRDAAPLPDRADPPARAGNGRLGRRARRAARASRPGDRRLGDPPRRRRCRDRRLHGADPAADPDRSAWGPSSRSSSSSSRSSSARRLATRGRLLTTGPVVALVVAVVLVGLAVDVRAARLATGRSVSERAAAAEINAWIRANAPAGSTVAIGPYLSMATAIDLPAGYRAAGLRHYLAVADPTAPLGLRGPGGSARDFIAIDTAPGKANDFNVYDAATLDRFIRTQQPDFLVYSVNLASSSRSILALLTPDRGFTELKRFVEDDPSGDIETHIYQVNRDRLAIGSDQISISAAALERLVTRLEQAPGPGRVAAANLLQRIVAPADGSLDALLARLRAIAGG